MSSLRAQGTRRLAASLACVLSAFAATPALADDGDIAAALRTLQTDRAVTRTVTLSDLGFNGPVLLSPIDARRELYLPVPANVAIDDATLSLGADYLKAAGGGATFVLSIDGYPVAGRSPDLASGTFKVDVGVDGAPRKSGFVRLGASWLSATDAALCGDTLATGNVVKIDPSTRFTYRYDPAAVRDLLTAWTAIPSAASVLIAGRALGAEAYDAAWRVGVALERAGKRPLFVALPAVGDTVAPGGAAIPGALAGVPAFAALSGPGPHKLANPAEVGAYLLLNGGTLADIAVADPALTVQIGSALDALAAEIAPHGADAAAAFETLRKSADSLAAGPAAPDEIGLAMLGGRPLIAIAPAAAGKADAIFSAFWRQLAVARSLRVQSAEIPRNKGDSVSLTGLSTTADSIDVLASSDWSAAFALSDLSTDGKVPTSLDLDVSAAPNATPYDPIVSVFLNDYLIGAKRLYADGHPERVSADIPDYALHPTNVLRVTFTRQPVSDRCPQAYPVTVLPSSKMTLSPAKPTPNFLGVVPRLAGASKLLLPTRYLTDAPETLASVVRLADGAGLSPRRASLTLVNGTDGGTVASAMPDAPFLALDVDLPLPKDRSATVTDGHLVLGSDPKSPLYDVEGLDRLGVIQAVPGDVPGLLYRQVGARGPVFDGPVRLAKGDIAVLSDAGTVAEIDSLDPAATRPAQPIESGWTISRLWQDRGDWGVPLIATVVVLILLLFARAAFVRNRRG
ncbi:hypothetical protein [Segnochrobactrum spirostomi]|uniref:Cyclic di-GMP-binding protein n=1 Tax=Segnochrobactrum spirostomi TaxID=2608987 RepID=A0A6A7XZ02_9HYPH|nr:hypothetical protein [Segnochrobactrum spirostomi]MQT12010.1 hypothetical protein [Segnochrobactrum spirostomi]